MNNDEVFRAYVYAVTRHGSKSRIAKIHHSIMLRMVADDEKDYVWRAELRPDGRVKLEYIGYLPITETRVKVYSGIDKCPEWVQDRIAVLRMMKPGPAESVVEGVGLRVSENAFWIVLPRELHGVDT